MSDEGFLGRWARLKQQQKREPSPAPAAPSRTAEPAAQPSASVAPPSTTHTAPSTAVEEELAKRIAKLPRIEDLTIVSDFRVFMQDWVPAPLRTAALSKLWRLDPAIRSFEGPARDYGFDYVTPGAAPGYGPLGPLDDVRGQLARLFQAPPEDAAKAAVPPDPAVRRSEPPADPPAGDGEQSDTPTVPSAENPGAQSPISTTGTPVSAAKEHPQDGTTTPITMPLVASSSEYSNTLTPVALQQKQETTTVSVDREPRRGRRHGGAIPS